jgi:hypothetical protein
MLQQLKGYVQEMGITDNFYQEMVNTEPTSIKLYDGGDIKNLVPTLDPTFDEIETSYDARKYGTNTAEMRIRERDRDSCEVNGHANWFFCMLAAEWGLSNAVWEHRSKNTSQCELSDEEKRTLKLVKRKERRDHPLYLKHEACERNIMLGR